MEDDTELELRIKVLLGELAGAASVCWTEDREFDSTQCLSFVWQYTNKIMLELKQQDKKALLAAKIIGHQEAMRPLLDEWSKL